MVAALNLSLLVITLVNTKTASLWLENSTPAVDMR